MKKFIPFNEEKDKQAICTDTAKIFEVVKNCRIHVNFEKNVPSNVTQYGSTFAINVQKTANQSSKTGFERSLARVIFNSDKTLADITCDQICGGSNQMKSTWNQAFQILDGVRTESNYGELYKGAKERFQAADQENAKNHKNDQINTPLDALYLASLGMTEKVKNSQFPDVNRFVSLVKNTASRASVIATKQFMEEVVIPWWTNKPEQEQSSGDDKSDGDNGDDSDKNGDSDKNESSKSNESSQSSESSESNESGESSQSGQSSGDQAKKEKDLSDSHDKINEARIASPMRAPNEQSGEIPDMLNSSDSIENEKQKAQEEIERLEGEISNAMEKVSPSTPKSDEIPKFKATSMYDSTGVGGLGMEKPSPREVKYNHTVSQILKKTFAKIKAKPEQELSEDGVDVDIDAFIRNQFESSTEFLLNDCEKTGFAVCIGVDCSGSMGGHNIDSARTLCATLYKSFENIPNVSIDVVGWTSNSTNCDIVHIKEFKDMYLLEANGGTPFQEATLFCYDLLKKKPHKQKLFFQITDGNISNMSGQVETFVKKIGAVIPTTVIHITNSSADSKYLRAKFGKENVITIQEMNERTNHQLTKSIAQRFMRVRSNA